MYQTDKSQEPTHLEFGREIPQCNQCRYLLPKEQLETLIVMKTRSVTMIYWIRAVSIHHEWVKNGVRFWSALLALALSFRLDLRVRFFII